MKSRTAHPPPAVLARLRRGSLRWWWPLVPLVVGVALVVVWHLAASPPSTVPRVSFVNNSGYDVEVEVTGGENTGTLQLGTAAARTTTVVEDVIDQGATWVVHFGAQGVDAGELRLTRADLDRADWKVVIPGEVAGRLAAAGRQESPRPPG
jgi:hypothetical protein